MKISKSKWMFLSSLAGIFLIAFWSYYVSYPGLLSTSGLEPVHRILPKVAPFLHEHVIMEDSTRVFCWSKMDIDSLCELLVFAGMMVSSTIFVLLNLRNADSTLLEVVVGTAAFLFLSVSYSFLTVQVGGTFYSFQWDTLLVETGMVTALCYISNHNHNNMPCWPLRFLLFKLMYMSGVVKIQAHCPTWNQLTALEFHFASQCLPGPLAWYAHQLPPFFLRLSVAMTLLIEIPASFLLLVPFSTIRRIGAILQIILQIMILLTGNYNFFNILTIALCFPCMESSSSSFMPLSSSSSLMPNNAANHTSKHGPKSFHVLQTLLQHVFTWGFLGWCFSQMFDVSVHSPTGKWNISLRMTQLDCDDLSNKALPVTIFVTVMIFIPAQTLLSYYDNPSLPQPSSTTDIFLHNTGAFRATKGFSPSFFLCLRMIVDMMVVGIMAVPMCFSLTPELQRNGLAWIPASQQILQPLWYHGARKHGMANGYGLFRRMTGVAHYEPQQYEEQSLWGWAGIPPSAVARPEIIMEGLFIEDDDDDKGNNNSVWEEIDFRYKPGRVDQYPRQAAPHQPRLDWQMWFAALSSYQRNPWFVQLSQKLLDGCEPVLDLVGSAQFLPVNVSSKKLVALRSQLYHMDFTRWDTEWNRKIPNVAILHPTSSDGMNHDYWKREFQAEYLPELRQDNPSLAEFLKWQGYSRKCLSKQEQCETLTPSLGCYATLYIRKLYLYLIPPIVAFFAALLVLFFGKSQQQYCPNDGSQSSRQVLEELHGRVYVDSMLKTKKVQ